MKQIIEKIFSISEGIRYIAIYSDGKLISSSRDELENASSSESDKYEELIVNPTLLKLVTQRGNIDCGGANFVLIRYGYFFEFVKPTPKGHISVGIELKEDPIETRSAHRKGYKRIRFVSLEQNAHGLFLRMMETGQ